MGQHFSKDLKMKLILSIIALAAAICLSSAQEGDNYPCKTPPTIISDPDSYNHILQSWPASNALTDSGLDYWVGKWGNGPRSFTMDLGCMTEISKVRLRNSYGLMGNE